MLWNGKMGFRVLARVKEIGVSVRVRAMSNYISILRIQHLAGFISYHYSPSLLNSPFFPHRYYVNKYVGGCLIYIFIF